MRVTGPFRQPSVRLDSVGAAKTALTVGGAIATGGWSLLASPLLNAADDPNPCATARASEGPLLPQQFARLGDARERSARAAARPVQTLRAGARARAAHSTNTRTVHASHAAGSMRA